MAGEKVSPAFDAVDVERLSLGSESPVESFGSGLSVNGKALESSGGGGTSGYSFDRRVTSTSDLENLPSNISAGETVLIEQPSTPYRPASWPDSGKYADIDVSAVRIVCESPYAADGQALIKPADSSDIGGLLIGSDGTTDSDIVVENWGWDGNESTMTTTVKRLHGITVDNAENVTIRGCYVTKTHPYNEHDSGGSGITTRNAAADIRISNCRTFDIGDRGIQVASTNTLVTNCLLENGYDRGVAGSVTEPDGNSYGASQLSIVNNTIHDNSDGSGIGGEPTNVVVAGNLIYGQHRRMVQFNQTAGQCLVVGNRGVQASTDASSAPGINVNSKSVVIGNYLEDYQGGGISGSDDVIIIGNEIFNVGGNGIDDNGQGDQLIAQNWIETPSGHGINGSGAHSAIVGNWIKDPQGTGNAGINSTAGDCLIASNWIKNAAAEGIKQGSVGTGVAIIGNYLKDNDSDSSGEAEISVADDNSYIATNYVESRGGSVSFEDTTGGNVWIANAAPDDGSAWSLTSSGPNIKSNYPTYHDLDEVLSGVSGSGTALSSSISGASLGDDIEVRATVNADPTTDAAFIGYPYWDDSASAVKAQVENKTSNSADVRVTAKIVG